jgi:DNA-directed RNA polymerase subunit N (RpoN/RPB10)
MAARIRCIQRYCTCLKPLGRFQAEIEMLLAEGQDISSILDHLGFTTSCCRLNIMAPPSYPVMEFDSGRMEDTVRILKSDAVRREILSDKTELYLGNEIKLPELPF